MFHGDTSMKDDVIFLKKISKHITKTCLSNLQRFFTILKMKYFSRKKKYGIFPHLLPKVPIACTRLKPPHRGGSNEHTKQMHQSKSEKKTVYPFKPHLHYMKVGCKRAYIVHGHVILKVMRARRHKSTSSILIFIKYSI